MATPGSPISSDELLHELRALDTESHTFVAPTAWPTIIGSGGFRRDEMITFDSLAGPHDLLNEGLKPLTYRDPTSPVRGGKKKSKQQRKAIKARRKQ